jgi:hypothetical protein
MDAVQFAVPAAPIRTIYRDGYIIQPNGAHSVVHDLLSGDEAAYAKKIREAIGADDGFVSIVPCRRPGRFDVYVPENGMGGVNTLGEDLLEYLGFVIAQHLHGPVLIVRAGDRGLDPATVSVFDELCDRLAKDIHIDFERMEEEMGREKLIKLFTASQLYRRSMQTDSS